MGKIHWNKNLTFLLGGQLISQLGDRFYAIALAFWVLDTTKSPSMMGVMLFCSMLPEIILGFVVGGVIDRFHRKTILVLADLIRGLVIAGITIVYYLGALNIGMIITAQVILSVCAAFFNPTIPSVMPQIVAEADLSKANSQSQFIRGITSIVGPVLGGVVVAGLGYAFVFIFNALSFFISGLLEGLLKLPAADGAKRAEQNIKESIIQGYRYIFARRGLVIILGMVAIIHFFVGAIQVFMPVFAVKLPGNGAQNLGFIETFFGVGTVLAAFALSLISIDKKEVKGLFGAVFVIGVMYLAIGLVNSLGVNTLIPFLPLFLILSGLFIVAGTSFQVILQKSIDNQMAGRVFGIVGSVGGFSIPVANLVFGWLLDWVKYYYLIAGAGLLLLPVSVILYLIYTKKSGEVGQSVVTENGT